MAVAVAMGESVRIETSAVEVVGSEESEDETAVVALPSAGRVVVLPLPAPSMRYQTTEIKISFVLERCAVGYRNVPWLVLPVVHWYV